MMYRFYLQKHICSFILKPSAFFAFILSIFLLINIPLRVSAQAPTIASFNPISAKPGSTITLTGTNFNSTTTNNVVFFGATQATITTATATSISVTVPLGATYAPITLLNTGTGLQAYSLLNFNPTYYPAKTSITTSTFANKQDFNTDTNPWTGLVGDFDGDGKPDMATANNGAASVSVLRNTSSLGTISFATKLDFAIASISRGAAVADLDGDGKLDLAIGCMDANRVSVLRNTSYGAGNISFATKVDFTTDGSPRWVAVGDLDGDGKPDLAVASNSSSVISIFRNTSNGPGNISFATKTTIIANTPVAVAIADFNGDGKPDITSTSYGTNNVSFSQNNCSVGTIAFLTTTTAAAGTYPYAMAIGDLDADNKQDIAVGNQNNQGANAPISLYHNAYTTGNISFSAKSNYISGTAINGVVIGDLTGDGLPDMASTNTNDQTISLFRNTNTTSGTLSFVTTPITYATGSNTSPYMVQIADFDGDGLPDLSVNNNATSTISVFRNKSNNANLSSLTISGGTLNPVFDGATTTYIANVSGATNSITVTPTKDAYAVYTNITVNGTTVVSANASLPITLNVGSNLINIVTTAEDGTTKTYTLTVTRPALITNDASLFSLSLSNGTLSPNFTAGTTSYAATVSYSNSSITLTPTKTQTNASITVNGTPVASGTASASIPLSLGDNIINTTVTAPDGITTLNYTVTVTRVSPSSDPTLSALNLSSGTLSPTFTSGTSSYTASVNNATSSITLTPISNHPNATININGTVVASASISNPIALAVGTNTITLLLTAEDGISTQTYTLSIIRATPSTDATLAAFAISSGTLSPAFSSGTLIYTASVTNATTSINVTPTKSYAYANISVNGIPVTLGSTSASIALNVGSNTINSVVTAQDGSTIKTYTLTVTRAGSPDATLSALSLSSGTLNPAFSSSVISYNTLFSNTTSSITVTPTQNEANATIKVNGVTVVSGNASGSISLALGTNNITIVVTAQDLSTKTYTIVAYKSASALAPVITSFSPLSAKPGTAVTLTGTDFNTTSANNVVFFGATRATIAAATATSLTVTVPVGATYAPISLLNTGTGLQAYSMLNFTPTYSPAKTSITTSTFAAKQDFTTGSAPWIGLIGDLDGDGKPDIATANAGATNFSVLRNTSSLGNLSFDPKIDFTFTATANYSRGGAIGDLDGDGKLDLAVTNLGGQVSVFLNTSTGIGNINFATKVDFTTGSSPRWVAIGDIDGDGKQDMAVACASGNVVSVFRNTSTGPGNISFATKVDISTTAPISVAIGDFNGDGKPDITVDNSTNNTVSIFQNTSTIGAISFTTTTGSPFAAAATPYDIAIGDLDGDNKQDIAAGNVGSNNSNINLYHNTYTTGNISFATNGTISSGAKVDGVAFGDLDGDGKPDLASANTVDNTITLRLNNFTTVGTISFASTSTNYSTGTNPNMVQIVDIDGDGMPDLVTENYGTNTISIFRNKSNNANLSALTINNGTLSPAFDASTTTYTADVTGATSSITITPTLSDASASIKVNGTTVASGSASSAINLSAGANTITTVVTAQDGSTKTYTLTVTRIAASTDATLLALSLSSGTLNPSFDATTISYSAAVSNSTSSITLTPTLNQANASVKVNGVAVVSGSASGAIALSIGDNTLTTIVTAQDGSTTKTYTVTVTRADVILPISLLNYEAKLQNNSAVKISWSTISETNNAGFEILRSKDGNTFSVISNIKGNGNSKVLNTYSFVDEKPFNGINYYRLVQIDFDGTRKEVGLKAINFDLKKEADFVIYPNPSHGIVHIKCDIGRFNTLKLIDFMGRIMLNKDIHLDQNEISIDVSNIPSASYLIILEGKSESTSKVLIVGK